jgi:hypothetical protein
MHTLLLSRYSKGGNRAGPTVRDRALPQASAPAPCIDLMDRKTTGNRLLCGLLILAGRKSPAFSFVLGAVFEGGHEAPSKWNSGGEPGAVSCFGARIFENLMHESKSSEVKSPLTAIAHSYAGASRARAVSRLAPGQISPHPAGMERHAIFSTHSRSRRPGSTGGMRHCA